MSQPVKAVYEDGVLRPLEPLDLKEEEVVSLVIEQFADNGLPRPLECELGEDEIVDRISWPACVLNLGNRRANRGLHCTRAACPHLRPAL